LQSPSSGASVEGDPQALEDRGVGFGYMVPTGNEPSLEPRPDELLLRRSLYSCDRGYLEACSTQRLFREACSQRARGPSSRLSANSGLRGDATAAMAHTGALAGAIETLTRLDPRGVIRVRAPRRVLSKTTEASCMPIHRGNRLAGGDAGPAAARLLIALSIPSGLNFDYVVLEPERQ